MESKTITREPMIFATSQKGTGKSYAKDLFEDYLIIETHKKNRQDTSIKDRILAAFKINNKVLLKTHAKFFFYNKYNNKNIFDAKGINELSIMMEDNDLSLNLLKKQKNNSRFNLKETEVYRLIKNKIK